MRKTALLFLALAVLTASRASGAVDFTVRGQYFHPTDKAFQDIYGGGLKAGFEIGFALTRRLDLWASGDVFSRTGELTYTGDETKLSLLPVGMGFRYRLTTGAVSAYCGAGVLACKFMEKNVLGKVSHVGLGGAVRTGVFVGVARGFLFHLGFGYSYCPMKPADFDIDVGGLEAGAGLSFLF